MFTVFGKTLAHTYYIDEKGDFEMLVRDIKDMHVVWRGSISKLQFYRAFFVWVRQARLEGKKSPILDNGDKTPS